VDDGAGDGVRPLVQSGLGRRFRDTVQHAGLFVWVGDGPGDGVRLRGCRLGLLVPPGLSQRPRDGGQRVRLLVRADDGAGDTLGLLVEPGLGDHPRNIDQRECLPLRAGDRADCGLGLRRRGLGVPPGPGQRSGYLGQRLGRPVQRDVPADLVGDGPGDSVRLGGERRRLPMLPPPGPAAARSHPGYPPALPVRR
jgi:hypothetical protein